MGIDFSATDYTFRPGQWLIGGQMMFVAFGALVLGAMYGNRGGRTLRHPHPAGPPCATTRPRPR